MKKLSKLTLNNVKEEKGLPINDLNRIRGGYDDPIFGGTLNTITVTPSGNHDDGYDPGHD